MQRFLSWVLVAVSLLGAMVTEAAAQKLPPEAATTPRYTPEADLPLEATTRELGEKHPHIIVAGHKLDYNPKKAWFYYAGTDVQAAWITFGEERLMGQTTRQLPGKPEEVYDPQTKTWAEYKPKVKTTKVDIGDVLTVEAKVYVDNTGKVMAMVEWPLSFSPAELRAGALAVAGTSPPTKAILRGHVITVGSVQHFQVDAVQPATKP